MFFTVSEKRLDNKESDLNSDPHQATIVTRLALKDQAQLELMLQLSCGRTRGVLIELPGVLLGTFSPVLESLQNMQRLCRLPFRQWILPDQTVATSVTNATSAEIPPPLYARGDKFAFSLKSILKDGINDMMLSSRASAKDSSIVDKIEAQTDLDRGQCQALIAALTVSSPSYRVLQGQENHIWESS